MAVKAAIRAGADVKSKGDRGLPALHLAAALGHLDVVRVLTNKRSLLLGVDLEAGDVNGRTALQWAAAEGHTSIVAALLRAGCNIESNEQHGLSLIHI